MLAEGCLGVHARARGGCSQETVGIPKGQVGIWTFSREEREGFNCSAISFPHLKGNPEAWELALAIQLVATMGHGGSLFPLVWDIRASVGMAAAM